MKRPSRSPASSRMRGFTLIELMVVLAIMALGAVVAAQRAREAFEDQQAKAAADNISVVGRAVTEYIGAKSATLGVAQDVTIAQLQSAGMLSPTFVGRTPWNSGYNIRIRRVPGGPPYGYEALIISTAPWVMHGATRIDLVGAAVQKIGGAAGMTYDTTGPVGRGGLWGPLPITDYPFANLPGQLAYYVSQSTNPNDYIYLRRDGTYPMTGNLQMGSNSVTGANSVTASGTVTGGTLTSDGDINIAADHSLQSTGRMSIQSGENLYLQPSANASGSLTIFGGSGGSGNATVSGTATVNNDVVISALASRANAPSTSSVKALLPDLVELNNYLINSNGQTIPVPVCDAGGTPNVFILPHVATGVAVGGKWGASIRMLGPSGGNWIVEALDANGAPLPNSDTPNFAALVRVFCSY